MCRTELTTLNQKLVRGRPVPLHCPSSWKSSIKGGDYKELQRFQRKDYIGCSMAHGRYLAPSQKLMSKTIIICVLLLGLIYQEGNEMKQNKHQNKRATSDRAYRKANKKLTTELMRAINTYMWSGSWPSRMCLSPSRGRNNKLYSSLWETIVIIHLTQATIDQRNF